MAEESIDLMVIPEKIELDGKVCDNGDGDPESLNNGDTTNDQFRRASISSTTFSESVNLTEKPLPHYLRASTGSCHDFCKFGRQHAFEEKRRRPQRKNLKSLPNEPDFVQIFVSGEKRKEKVVSQKLSVASSNRSRVSKSSDMKSHLPTAKDKSNKVIKQKQSHDLNLYPDEMKLSPTPKVKETKSFRKRSPKVPVNNVPELKPSSDPKPRLSSMTSLSTRTHPLSRTASSVNNTRLSTFKPLRTQKFPSPDHPEIVKTDVILSSRRPKVGGETSSSANVKVSRAERNTERSSSLKAKGYKVKPLSASGNSSGLNRREVKTMQKKPLAHSASLSSNLSLSKTRASKPRKEGNPLKDRNKTQNAVINTSESELVPEKTLHVITTETENSPLELNYLKSNDNVVPLIPSPSSHRSPSEGTSSDLSQEADDLEAEYSGEDTDDISCDDKEIVEIDEVEPGNENDKKILRKSKVVASEVKHQSPVKLKFRSGKVVDLHTENNTPRRLKFRRARNLGIDQGKVDSSKRTFKKAGDNDIGEELSSEKIALKHQGVQGKKGEQGLFNNVIEETASKLAESRKSKVKALVGAFETVISLQERKPASSNTVN